MNSAYICIYVYIFSFIVAQNFRYTSEDWYILTKPGSINSISQDNFKIYFAADNGIFSYDKNLGDFQFDTSLSNNLESQDIAHIYYDRYRGYYWIVWS